MLPLISRRRALLGMASLGLTAAASPDDLGFVSVADFGVRPGMDDAGPGVRAAIARLGKRPGAVLHFPPGMYRFAAREGVAMLFDDMDHLTVEGEGATLLFNGTVAPVLMRGCRAPVLHGLTFDWERPPFSQGEVIAVGLDGRSVTIRIDPEFPVDGGETIRELGTYDRRTRAMAKHGIDVGNVVAGAILVAPQTLLLTLKWRVPFTIGDTVVARHQGGPSVIHLERCRDFVLSNLAIHAAPAIAIGIGGCDGGTVSGVRVEQQPGSARLMSSNADGLHCASCSGDLTITDCTFSGMGDDGINVTGLYLAVEPDKAQQRLILTGGQYAPAPPWAAPRIGDRLRLVSGSTLKPIDEVQAQSVEPLDGGRWAVQVPADHIGLSSEPMFAIDLRARTRLLVSRCAFPGNRARGVLAHSDAIVERSSFEHQSDSAILLAPDLYWQEGPAIEQTVVRGNLIQAANLLARTPAAILVGAFVAPAGRPGVPTSTIINRNVAIEGNHFLQPNGAAISAAATRDLRIEENRIEQASSIAFSLHHVRAARLSGNRCDPRAVVQVDAKSRGELIMDGNAGLGLEIDRRDD
ncbi:glycosyl hydrolase family 28 protein [Rhodopila globiformis]|uniref:Right handed beta helix domain-containing protein n=1 Tax=Rhodopila globiformis TaxID=1071 RepID=A0A2S6N1T3_RHOGL|nr:glycosyl hydrolase family 28 protein [Rhodopila globiformis]PPQ28583.1 hypothetical protein CCS01_24080 [Rhodopila globiformis]